MRHLIGCCHKDACRERGPFIASLLGAKAEMTIEVSAEMVRLLGVLADCPDGATQHELAMQGVKSSLIYEAVMLSLVRATRERAFGQATYRFQVLAAGIKLINVQE